MDDLIKFLQSDEAIMVYIIASIISIIYIIYYYFRKTKMVRLQRQNTMELNRIVDETLDFAKEDNSPVPVNQEVKVIPTIEKEKVIEPVIIKTEEKIESLKVETVPITKPQKVEIPVVENTPVQEVLYQPVNMKVEGTIEVLEEKKKTDTVVTKTSILEKNAKLDEVLKKIYPKDNIEEDIPVINVDALLAEDNNTEDEILYTNTVPDEKEAKKELEEITRQLEQEENKTITLTEFEQLQEDTAIISLEELMKKAGTMYEVNEEIQYKDEGNEPISISDLEKRKQEMLMENKKVEQPIVKEEVKNKKGPGAIIMKNTKDKIFKSSKVISPVYGRSKSTELELENTANYEKLDEEIRKTNEFLATLKELQKNLD